MRKNLYLKFLLLVITILTNFLSPSNTWANDDDGGIKKKPKSNSLPLPIKKPLPKLLRLANLSELAKTKTVFDEDNDRELKYIEDNVLVDCIRYNFSTSNKSAKTGEEVELKLHLEMVDGLPLVWRDEDCQKLAIKVVFPKGFVQTGGNYYDFVNLNFDENTYSADFIIKGTYQIPNEKSCFLLLKGPTGSNWETIFVKKRELCVNVSGEALAKPLSKIAIGNDYETNDIFKTSESVFQSVVTAACIQPPAITALSRCGSGTVTITATGCTNVNPAFKWYDVSTGGAVLFTGNPFTTPILSTNKTYYVECTSTTNDCSPASPRRAVSVTINPNATATNTSTLAIPICVGSNVTLTANTGTGLTYSWTGPNGFSSTSRTPVIVAPTSNGTYIVSVKNTSNCTSTASTIVYVKPLPAPPILTGTPRCGTGTVNLTSAGCAGTVNWYTALTGGTSLSTAANYTTPSISATRNYFASCTFNGCTSSPRSSVAAIVNPIPAAPGAGNNSRCGAGTVILQATGCAGTVNWYASNTATTSLGTTASFTTPSLSTTTSYFANCTVNGCTSATRRTVTATITIPPPIGAVPTSSGIYCVGGAISITASGANNYTWAGPGGFTASGATMSRASITTAMGGVYTVSGLATGNICPGTATVNITVNPIPTAATALSNSPVCVGNPLNLTATGGNVYAWAGPNSFTATTASVTRTPTTAAMGGIYTITVRNAGCAASVTATTNVIISTLPTPTITGVTTICEGGTTSLTATGGTTYAWSGPNSFTATGASATFSNAALSAAGTYSVTVTNASLCTATASSILSITARPNAPTVEGTATICTGTSTNLTASGCDGSLTWSNSATATSISVSPTTTTNYTATCSANGCTSVNSTAAVVTVTAVPPAPTIAGTATICSGTSTSLTASGCAGTTTWSNGATTTSISVSPTTTTNYTATCTIGACISVNSSIATITVTSLPNAPTVVGTVTICSGSTATISGTCTTGILTWYATPSGGSSIGTDNYTTSILSNNTTYYAACETGGPTNCVSSRTPIDIITNPILIPTATTTNTTICGGQSTTLTATGCGDFGYIWSNSLTSSSINVGSAGTYSVKCIIPGCVTSSSNEVSVNVIPQPVSPIINANGTSYYDPNTGTISKKSKGYLYVSLQATGCNNGTLTWYQSGTVLGYGNNTYYYEDLNYAAITAICTENNCDSQPSNQITIQGCSTLKPILTVSNANPATCEEITLTVTNIENIFTDGGGLITKYINNQYAGLVGFNNNNGIPGYGNYVATVKATESMSFDVYLAQSTPYCESQVSDKVSISVSVPISKPTVINDIQSICSGESATFTASGCNGIYKWTNAYDGSVPAQYGATFNTPVYNVSGASAFGYNVACIVDNCESAVTVVSLTVYPKQTPTNIISNGSNLICNGNSITLSSTCPLGYDVVWNVVGAASSTYDYNSSPIIRIGYNTVTPIQTTTYFAYCVSGGGAAGSCTSDASQPYTVTVNNNSPTTPTITANKTILCSSDNDGVILTPSTCDGTITWNWSNAGSSGTTTSIGSLTVTGLTQNITYKSKCTNGCGTSNWSNEITIYFVTTPSAPTISSDKILLNSNETATLTATGCSGMVIWSNGMSGNSIGVTTSSIINFSAICTISGCNSVNSNTVTLTPCGLIKPVLSQESITNIGCSKYVTLTTNCSGSVLWENYRLDGTTLLIAQYGNSYPFKITEDSYVRVKCFGGGNYQFDGPNGCESSYSDPFYISVDGPKQPVLTADKPFINSNGSFAVNNYPMYLLCNNQSLNITVSNCNGVVQWYKYPNNFSNPNNYLAYGNSISFLGSSTISEYDLYVARCSSIVNPSQCYADKYFQIKVMAAPTISITSNSPVIENTTLSFTLNTTGTNTYAWVGPNNFTSSLQNPSIPNIEKNAGGIYTVTVSNLAGCSATATATVQVIATQCNCETDADKAEWQTEKVSNNAIFTNTSINNVVENTYLAKTQTIDGTNELVQTITYIDGLGRTMQTISRGVSPTGKDIVAPIQYDEFGRSLNNYLPYIATTNGLYQTNALKGTNGSYTTSAQSAFYADPLLKNDGMAYSASIIEKSPIGRLLQQGSVGSYWQPNEANPTTANSIKLNYHHNTDNSIKKLSFDYSGASPILILGNYTANQLYVSETKDEKNNIVEEYSDNYGRTICKIVFNGTEKLKTYNAYDDFGRLRFTLPPKASDILDTKNNGEIDLKTDAQLKDFIFFYDYDARGRVTQKKVADADPEEMVYNPFNQLVLYRNALHKSKDIWMYTKYDELGRTVSSGILNSNQDRLTLQAAVYAMYADGTAEYGDNAYPTASFVEKTHNYYDTYPTIAGVNTSAAAVEEFGLGNLSCNTCTISLKGKLTVSKEMVEVPTGATTVAKTELYTTYLYDEYGRTVQVRSQNHLSQEDISSVSYDFAGRALETKLVEKAFTTNPYKVWTKNTYDRGNRLKMTLERITDANGTIGKIEPVGRYKYNELGELIEKWQGCKQQVISYKTNIKGWLLNINGSADPTTLGIQNKFFGMTLSYDQQNGDITEQAWGTVPHFRTGATLPALRKYNYTYDALSRLTGATYTGGANENFDLNNLTYDKNGNILSMNRRVQTPTLGNSPNEDNLKYFYPTTSNRLRNVKDLGIATPTDAKKNHYFNDRNIKDETTGYDGNAATDDYVYDNAGNITEDRNRALKIVYNYLGLPEKITYNNTTDIYYIYTATGEKIQKQGAPLPRGGGVGGGPITSTTIDYKGQHTYINGVLEHIETAEGRALPALPVSANIPISSPLTQGFRYEYIQTDYLGNPRTACRCGEKTDNDGNIIPTLVNEDARTLSQENHFDPWGLNLAEIESKTIKNQNWWQFNNDTEKGYMSDGSFDYETTFRNYDAQIGRFKQIDLLADDTPGINGYQFGYNNPVSFTDRSGLQSNGIALPELKVYGKYNHFANINVGVILQVTRPAPSPVIIRSTPRVGSPVNQNDIDLPGLNNNIDTRVPVSRVPLYGPKVTKEQYENASVVYDSDNRPKFMTYEVYSKKKDLQEAKTKFNYSAPDDNLDPFYNLKPEQKLPTYVTYTKYNPTTGETYSGRSRGTGTPEDIVKARDAGHDMPGFEEAKLDRYAYGTLPISRRWLDPSYQAHRGREQLLIDAFGGPISGKRFPGQITKSANKINGISPDNGFRNLYIRQAILRWGLPQVWRF